MLLNLLDLRTPPARTVHRSTVPDNLIANLASMIRKGNGMIADQLSFEIGRTFLPRHGIPGTAFGSGHESPRLLSEASVSPFAAIRLESS
jgi:hypothetical protein